eukprot:1989704-Prorocentrum_lima.AAC.1
MPGTQAPNEYCHTLIDDFSGRLRHKRGSSRRGGTLRSRRDCNQFVRSGSGGRDAQEGGMPGGAGSTGSGN